MKSINKKVDEYKTGIRSDGYYIGLFAHKTVPVYAGYAWDIFENRFNLDTNPTLMSSDGRIWRPEFDWDERCILILPQRAPAVMLAWISPDDGAWLHIRGLQEKGKEVTVEFGPGKRSHPRFFLDEVEQEMSFPGIVKAAMEILECSDLVR